MRYTKGAKSGEKQRLWGAEMYKKRDRNQIALEGFHMPFGGKLRAENRWVKLAEMLPWDFIEDIYAQRMSEENGAGAISARIAFGSLYIRENEKLTDERTLENTRRTPIWNTF